MLETGEEEIKEIAGEGDDIEEGELLERDETEGGSVEGGLERLSWCCNNGRVRIISNGVRTLIWWSASSEIELEVFRIGDVDTGSEVSEWESRRTNGEEGESENWEGGEVCTSVAIFIVQIFALEE